jgi:hypothetical protein
VIEMEVTDPDGVEVRPIETFLCHAVRGIGAYVEQCRAGGRFEIVCGRRAFRMGLGRAGTEYDQLHFLITLLCVSVSLW